MTTKRELDSQVVTKLSSTGIARPKLVTDEILESIQQKPIKTVWGWDFGRPIYDRLPAVSEQYKKGYDRDQAYVYLDPQFGKYEGPGSLDVVTLFDDPTALIVEPGVITWEKGQLAVDGFNVDISTLNFGQGLADGDYQVGYELTYDIPITDTLVPGYALGSVKEASLGDAAISIAASGASQYHEAYYAISDADIGSSWWPGFTTYAGVYFPGSWFVIDFRAPVGPERFEIIADPGEPLPTAKLAVYGSDDAIVWREAREVRPIGDRWIVDINPPAEYRYWKLFFWDGTASISDIVYSGTAYFPDLRVSGPVQVATPFLDNLYEEPPENYLLLASFKVQDGRIGSITDYRSFTSRKYEPVASWVTDFQDANLRCLFTAVENYSELYMAPPTADYHFYKELDDSLCFGLGEFDLAGELGTITFPDRVEFWCTDKIVNLNPSYSFDINSPSGQLGTDPNAELLISDGFQPIGSGCSLKANQIILLKDPELPSDLATRVYSDITLYETWSIDNGIYY